MPFILARHAERVKATKDQLNLKLPDLRTKKVVGKLATNPGNCSLLRERQEVNNDIAKTEIKLNDEVKMKLTDNERTALSKVWRTHQESSNSLKKSRGKVYSLLLEGNSHRCWWTR